MLQQYFDLKEKHQDCILFFRMGDFYEMFGQDAIDASAILEITLTARQKGKENEIPMCGVPHHAAANYIGKLTKAGRKVAIGEQVSDPKLPGLVERDVVRVITPGTTFDDTLLEKKEHNYLLGVSLYDDTFFVGMIEVTTGEFQVAQFYSQQDVLQEINRREPQEIIVTSKILEHEIFNELEKLAVVHEHEIGAFKNSQEILLEHFKVPSLHGFGLDGKIGLINTAAHLLDYVLETQRTQLEHIRSISILNTASYMMLDDVTIRNLDLLYNSFDGTKQNSFLSVIDKTVTAMGGRLLRSWILQPLIQKEIIEQRLDRVQYFLDTITRTEELRFVLKQVGDIQRLLGRIGCGRCNARDLVNLKNSLNKIPNIVEICGDDSRIKILLDNIDDNSEVREIISQTILEEPPLTITEGGMIAEGVNAELDELRSISISGKDFIKQLQAREIEATGITSLKVKFNKVFGYYLEVSKSYIDKVPEHYIRKQTLVNAERYIIPELKEYEQKVLSAEDKIKDLEYKIFLDVIEKIKPHFDVIQKNAEIIAQLDVYAGFAEVAYHNNYCRPEIHDDGQIKITNGRHPVIEKSDVVSDYIPNDTTLGQDHQMILLTGPNMAGKSSYLRQIALMTLMGHIGCFVSAEKAELVLVDRIFTRVGASDNLSKGQSTFMVEMQEAANILHNATDKSLIILDEVGRGTSTYDGLSIAWAITEYIYHQIGAKTLFATHYHELIHSVEKLPNGQNYAMAVKEVEDTVLFLHQVVKGGCNQSYGIEVAQLAGMPQAVVQSAQVFLSAMELKKDSALQPSLFDVKPVLKTCNCEQNKKTIHEQREILQKIKEIDVNNSTPLEIMNYLVKLQKEM